MRTTFPGHMTSGFPSVPPGQGGMAARTRGVSEDGPLGVRYASATFIDGYNIATDVISHALDPMPSLVLGTGQRAT